MKTLVTGANGSIGRNLVQALVARGDDVKVLVRENSNTICLDKYTVEFCHGDILDTASLNRALENVDLVYHLAAIVPPRLWRVPNKIVWDINYHGTRNLLEACRQHELKKVIYASTVGVTGYIDHGRIDETSPYNPEGLYEKTKCEAEKIVLKYYKEYGVPTTIIRIPAVYGPGLVYGMVQAFQAIQSRRFRFFGTGESLIHLIYMEDLIEVMLLIGMRDAARGEIYIVGMKDPVTWKEYVTTIAEGLGVDPPRRHLPIWLAKTLGYCFETLLRGFYKDEPFLVRYRVDLLTNNSAFDVSKVKKELGFEAKMDLKEGIAHTIQWYRKEGYLSG